MSFSRLWLFLAVAVSLPSLAANTISSSAVFSSPTDVARFGSVGQVALTRVEGDAAHVQVAAYGDAPVVRFVMDKNAAAQCAHALTALMAPPVKGAAPAHAQCESSNKGGDLQVAKNSSSRYDFQFSDAKNANVVLFSVDEGGFSLAQAAFQAATRALGGAG